MITYELAVALKDAGFKGSEKWEDNGDFFKSPTPTPTLSELIEACGTGFENLTRDKNAKWLTNYFEDSETGAEWNDTEGSTPEIAVANLWLALNKKI